MKTEKNRGIGWQQIGLVMVPIMISMVVAIFLSYTGMNQKMDASSQQINQRIDASNRQINERLDKIFARIDTLNREMGEIKTEMSGMNREISEMKAEIKFRFIGLEKGK